MTSYVRKGGPRIDYEIIKGKKIFHNYGFGVDEVILSNPSVNISIKQLNLKFERKDVY